MLEKNVMGFEGLVWSIGVVEDRIDPLAIGRVRVRAYNIHTASLTDIPTTSLPWAQVASSINLDIKESDTVLVFFADGRSCQIPIVVAKLEGFQVVKNNQGAGFNDLRANTILQNAPRPPLTWTYKSDGSGIVVTSPNIASPYPLANELGAPTLSGATRFDIANTVIQQRINNLDKNIPGAAGIIWSEPYPAFNPLYPYNKAEQSESGHIIEVDDTPGNERLAWTHRTGTFDEIYPSGTRVQKVTKSNYSIVMGDDFAHIMGRCILTVGQGVYIKVIGDANIECDGDLDIGVAGDANFSVGGGFNVKAKSINMAASDTTVISDSILLTGDADVSGQLSVGNGLQVIGSTAISGPVSLDGPVLADSVNPGATPASGAQSGSAVSLPTPPKKGNPTNGSAGTEPTPTPWPHNFKYLDAYTGTTLKQNMLLTPIANGAMIAPDSNASNVTCNYDANVHTFLSSDIWTISQDGLIALQQREGLAKLLANGSIQAYPDPVIGPALLTIGYGTTSVVLPPEDALTHNTIIEIAQANQYLLDAINNIFLPKLKATVTVDLTQNMIDAILSFMYNIGIGNWQKSAVLNFTNQKQWCSAAAAFLHWVTSGGHKVSGLVTRRAAEKAQYLK